MYVEKGHCHITVPKVEVILPLNNIKASLRSGVQRLRQGRHAGQVGMKWRRSVPLPLHWVLQLLCIGATGAFYT